MSLQRTIQFTERHAFTLRGEFYNVFNHGNLGINGVGTSPSYTLINPDFNNLPGSLQWRADGSHVRKVLLLEDQLRQFKVGSHQKNGFPLFVRAGRCLVSAIWNLDMLVSELEQRRVRQATFGVLVRTSIIIYRKRPGGSAGAGMEADLPFPGALGETLTGAGLGRPMPVFNSK